MRSLEGRLKQLLTVWIEEVTEKMWAKDNEIRVLMGKRNEK